MKNLLYKHFICCGDCYKCRELKNPKLEKVYVMIHDRNEDGSLKMNVKPTTRYMKKFYCHKFKEKLTHTWDNPKCEGKVWLGVD